MPKYQVSLTVNKRGKSVAYRRIFAKNKLDVADRLGFYHSPNMFSIKRLKRSRK